MSGSHCIQCGRPALPEQTLCAACLATDRTYPAFHQEKTELHRTGIPATEQTIITNAQKTPSYGSSPMTSPGGGPADNAQSHAGGTRPGGVAKTETFSRDASQPVDRFTVQQILGEGGQGQVCRAFDNQLQRAVAIKFPRQTTTDDAAAILDEARKAARLNHPNVVTIYECGIWQDRPYICMELVDGTSLATIIKELGRVSPAAFVRYSQQILRALEAAHANGLIHRDLKPHNVLQAKDGSLKLTDFGIAHLASAHKPTIDQKTGMMMVSGTPAYMAPEVWRGKTPDRRSDIYAYGCMAYELLAGRQPFTAKDVAREHLDAAPKPIRDWVPGVPQAIERVVLRCLEKNPADRFQDAQAVREAIEAAAREDQITETNYARQAKKSGAGKAVAALFVVLVLGGSAFFAAHPEGKELWRHWTKDAGAEAQKPAEKPADTAAAIFEKQRKKGAELLSQALAQATDPAKRRQLADEAAALLEGTEKERAEEIKRGAETEISKLNVQKTVASFDGALQAIRDALAKDDVKAASDRLAEAERAIDQTPALAEKKEALKAERLGYESGTAAFFADVGEFASAADGFDRAARLAAEQQKKTDADELAARAELTRELSSLQKMAARQPRFVLVRLKQLRAGGKALPAGADLLEAEVQAALGQATTAKDALEKVAQTASRPSTKERAQKLAQTLR